LKLGIAGLGHETITFWPGTTGLEAFRRDELLGRNVVEKRRGTNTPIGGFVEVCESEGVEMLPVCAAFGGVTATVADEVFHHYVGEMKRGFVDADLDGVLLEFHGAMVTESLQDTETHIVKGIREAVGYGIPIMVALDLHANLSPAILEEATMVFGYHSSPHLDRAETGRRAARAMLAVAQGEVEPAAAIAKPGLVVPSVFSYTGTPPGSEIIERVEEWMRRPGVLDASMFFSFAWADVHQLGMSAVALTDGDPDLAREVVDDLSAFAWERRELLTGGGSLHALDDGVRRAIERSRDARRPVILLDHADRTNDTTFVLRELLRQGAENAALPLLWDPGAAQICAEAGVGATVQLDVGGSTGWRDGGPVNVRGRVMWVGEGRYVGTGPMTKGLQVDQGTTAILDVDSVWLQLVSRRVGITGGALIDEDPITQFGYKTQDFDIIVTKSKTHFRAVYAPISEEIIVVDAPGQCPADLRAFEYKNVPPGVYPVTTD
jgi:microcystin degradation protein MlrC